MEDSHIISTIYLADTGLEILSLRRSSRQREFVCYLNTWKCDHLLLISSLGFICSRSGYAYLYICKKKKKKKRRKKSLLLLLAHVCMCIVFSIIEYVYRCLWSFLSSMFVIRSSYVSSLGSHVICIASSYLFVREMSDLLLRTPSHCPFHHYIHY